MSYLRINTDYYRTPEFIKFDKSFDSTVYNFILSGVTRRSPENNLFKGGNYIYNEFYLNGDLVSRYSQEDMAEYLMSSQSSISRSIKNLEEKNYIKKHKRNFKNKNILFYQVGVWEGNIKDKTYKEILWAHEIFNTLSKIAKQKRWSNNKIENSKLNNMVGLLNRDYEDYEVLKSEWMRDSQGYISP
jgi:predicted transcriptional regulator